MLTKDGMTYMWVVHDFEHLTSHQQASYNAEIHSNLLTSHLYILQHCVTITLARDKTNNPAMDRLPNELLIQIAFHLDHEPPSIAKFAHEPSVQLTCSDWIPLKTLSQVSWPWRKIVLPILFRYSRIPLDNESQWVSMNAQLLTGMELQLTKLSDHEFKIYAKMRSRSKSNPTFYKESINAVMTNLCRVQDGDDFFKSLPSILWFPHLPNTFAEFRRFVTQYTLKHHIKSIVMHTNKEEERPVPDTPLARAVFEIWTQVFSCLEPNRVVVAAPPRTLAALLDTQTLSNDIWAFGMETHYIELLQPEPLRLDHISAACERPWDSALIHRRPWYHIGYNEGSSISAYSTYEYHAKQCPRILYLTLLRLAKEAQTCCNITSFSFTGVFPFATNVTSIVRALHHIPTIKNVSFQLAPGPENDLLSDAKRRGRAQSSDFWLEWRESYKCLSSYLGIYQFADGSVFNFEEGSMFVSKDCGGKQLATEVGECMASLRKRGVGWRGDGDGRWVRDHALDEIVADLGEDMAAMTVGDGQ
jgi:hypothetical protein